MSIDPTTLTKAVLKAAGHLGLLEALPFILAIDEQRAANLVRGECRLDPNADEWVAATRFASLFRSLLTLLGSPQAARAWLAEPHATLGAPPAELLRTAQGRERVLGYLDAVQKYEIKLPPRGSQH